MSKICLESELGENQRVVANGEEVRILIFKDKNGNIIAMDAVCPHSGGPLEKGPLEEIEDLKGPLQLVEDIEDLKVKSCAIVCPWHSYRFDVHSGKSLDDDLFVATLYSASVSLDGYICINDFDFALQKIEFFPDPSSSSTERSSCDIDLEKLSLKEQESLEETINRLLSLSLVDWCIAILNTPDPYKKVSLTHEMKKRWDANEIKSISPMSNVIIPDRPARQSNLSFVDPSKTKRRGNGGSIQSRINILHALANVEQWAIDLAVDIMARFHKTSFTNPRDGKEECLEDQKGFFDDFVRIASEEAKHFTFLLERLRDLGAEYGDLPCHEGLWDSASQTKHSLRARLAIVHMVHEARGLDVNPQTIEKFRKARDLESVERLTTIHNEEVGHVAAGQRWFKWSCSVTEQDRYTTFHEIVRENFHGYLKPPFNEQDRQLADLDAQYYLPLATPLVEK